jgi:formate dehydrogenase
VNHPVIPIIRLEPTRQRKRAAPRGRRVDPVALAEVQALLGAESRQSDLLIEHLHKIQDRYGHLSTQHLAALAQEMRLAQTEVYEVASFYHHFDIVREGDAAPAPLTVRVCDSLSCELAGAGDLLERLPTLLGRDVRVMGAPCIGRCEQAPAVLVGQNAIARASLEAITAAVQAKATAPESPECIGLDRYRAGGGYALLQACVAGTRSVESVIRVMEDSGLRGLGGAGFPAGRKWRIVGAEPARASWPSTSTKASPAPSRTASCSSAIRTAFSRAWPSRLGGGHRAGLHLPARRVPRAARHAGGRGRQAARRTAGAELPEMILRRGAGAYICGEESAMIESIEGKRGMPRPAPALRRPGRPVRPADARAQLRDAVLGARAAREGRRLVRVARPATAAKAFARSRFPGG